MACLSACVSGDSSPQTDTAGWIIASSPVIDISAGSESRYPLLADPIAAARLSGGTIVVADRSIPALLYFDKNGSLVRTVGRKGKGPEEFEDLIWMGQCGPDSLFVLDGGLRRMFVIDSAGRFVRQAPFPVLVDQLRVACSRNGRFATMRHLTGGDHVDVKTWTFSQARGSLLISGPNGELRQVLTDIPIKVPRPLGQLTFLALSPSRVYVGTNDSAVVEILTLSGKPIGRAGVSVSRRKPTADQYDLGIDAHLAVVFASLAERREHKDRFTRIPPPEFLPLYGSLFVDAVDTAWVVISPFDDKATRLQMVVTASNGPIITLPERVNVFEIGRDYILARRDDSDGEVHIVSYGLSRP